MGRVNLKVPEVQLLTVDLLLALLVYRSSPIKINIQPYIREVFCLYGYSIHKIVDDPKPTKNNKLLHPFSSLIRSPGVREYIFRRCFLVVEPLI